MSRKEPKYSEAMALIILDRVSGGDYLPRVCKDMRVGQATVYGWMWDHPDFGARLDAATKAGREAAAKKALAMAGQPASASVN